MMPVDDLSSISDLDDKQRALLAEKLNITTWCELIMADRHEVVSAFNRRANRPTLEQVAAWQDEARRAYSAAISASASAIAASGWEQVATFVVAFEQRRRGDATDRRIVAEQTEVEPEAAPQQRSQWSDWMCDDACRWMVERVGEPATSSTPSPGRMNSGTDVPAALPRAAGARSRIDIERATLADAGGDAELVADSRSTSEAGLVWIEPTQLIVTLSGAPTGHGTSVVLQLAQVGGAKQSIAGHVDDAGRVAEIDLRGLATGEYEPTIAAWRPDGSSSPRIVKLPTVAVVGTASGPSSRT